MSISQHVCRDRRRFFVDDFFLMPDDSLPISLGNRVDHRWADETLFVLVLVMLGLDSPEAATL